MFDTLLASHSRTRSPRWGVGFAVVVHASVLGVLLRPSAQAAAPMVMISEESFPLEEPTVRPPRLGPPSVSVPTDLIDQIICDPPLIEGVLQLVQPIPGVPGSLPVLVDSTAVPAGDPWPSSMVQESPVLLTAPLPDYPTRLREAGIQGRVIVEAVVDTLGRVEPGSIRVVSSDHADFEPPATASIRAALFRPARVYGRAVRVLIRVPVAFRLR